jgi:hypothetical protein
MEKKEFIKQWMKTYEPDTFKAGENGRYFYRSEDLSSGIDLECFFEDLLTDFESALAKETEQQSNCNLPHVSSSLRERELNKYLEEINTLMWNTWGVKHNKFDKEEGSKIMSILNRWASNDC